MDVEHVKLLLRKPACWLGMCACDQQDDDTHIWGECVHCHKRFGVISRASVRRYIEIQEARRALSGDAT